MLLRRVATSASVSCVAVAAAGGAFFLRSADSPSISARERGSVLPRPFFRPFSATQVRFALAAEAAAAPGVENDRRGDDNGTSHDTTEDATEDVFRIQFAQNSDISEETHRRRDELTSRFQAVAAQVSAAGPDNADSVLLSDAFVELARDLILEAQALQEVPPARFGIFGNSDPTAVGILLGTILQRGSPAAVENVVRRVLGVAVPDEPSTESDSQLLAANQKFNLVWVALHSAGPPFRDLLRKLVREVFLAHCRLSAPPDAPAPAQDEIDQQFDSTVWLLRKTSDRLGTGHETMRLMGRFYLDPSESALRSLLLWSVALFRIGQSSTIAPMLAMVEVDPVVLFVLSSSEQGPAVAQEFSQSASCPPQLGSRIAHMVEKQQGGALSAER
jgi:hypothetical protein